MTTLREAAQQALEALEIGYESAQVEAAQFHAAMAGYKPQRHAAMDADVQKIARAITALKAALAEYDKDRVKVEEMKANWALQRKLADETYERDKQQREYEEQRLAALAEPVQQGCAHCNHPMYAAIKCKVCGRVTEPVQEPYAWMSVGGSIWRHKTTEDDVPLYTAPRKPLAEWQINDLMSDIDPEDRDSWSFRQGVYAAEKHHGVRR